MHNESEKFKGMFPEYDCEIISADDVRDKKPRKAVDGNCGMMSSGGEVKYEYMNEFRNMFKNIEEYFNE